MKREMDKLARIVSDWYTKCKDSRNKIQMQWYMNLAFYYGKQNVRVLMPGDGQYRLSVPNAPYWRSRPVINRIRPMIRTELAKLTAQKPTASIVPASSDDADLFAARAGEQVWEAIQARQRLSRALRRALFWTTICGTGFIKTWWDSSVIDKDSGMPGDVCIAPVTPFHLFVPDLREEELENQPYVINAYTKPVEWITSRYRTDLSGRPLNPSCVSSNELLDDAFLNLVGVTQNNDSCLVMEAWIKPGCMKDFPQGAMVTVVDDQVILASQGWPYLHGEYPFSKFDHLPTGKFYAESTIVDLLPLQKEYNRTRGQIIEAKNRMAKPQLIAARGSIDASKITTEPGQVIFYVPGFPAPAPLPLQPLPAYVLQELDRTLMDMDDISGQHEISKGQTPPGVTAATAITYLQEQDETKLAYTFASVEEGIQQIAHQTLSHVVQFWTVPRMVKVTGADGGFDSILLKNSDLRQNTDIRVEGGSALPVSKAAKQAFIMDLMKMGFIPPEKGLELMEMGGVQKLYDEIQIDQSQARRENLRMKAITPEMVAAHYEQFVMAQQGAPVSSSPPGPAAGAPLNASPGQTDPSQTDPMLDPSLAGDPNDPTTTQKTMDPKTGLPLQPPPIVPVNTWDNHQIHILLHNNFRKSQEFEMLDEGVKMLFEEHVQLHVMAMTSGMPPAAGGPPGLTTGGMPGMTDPNANPVEQLFNPANSSSAPPDTSAQVNTDALTKPPLPEGASGGQR